MAAKLMVFVGLSKFMRWAQWIGENRLIVNLYFYLYGLSVTPKTFSVKP